jgi:hypothetical protein
MSLYGPAWTIVELTGFAPKLKPPLGNDARAQTITAKPIAWHAMTPGAEESKSPLSPSVRRLRRNTGNATNEIICIMSSCLHLARAYRPSLD